MSIGRDLGRMVDTAIIVLGGVADRFFNTHWPMRECCPVCNAADKLADREAETEVFEPDELWMAEQMFQGLSHVLFKTAESECRSCLSGNPIYRDLQLKYEADCEWKEDE